MKVGIACASLPIRRSIFDTPSSDDEGSKVSLKNLTFDDDLLSDEHEELTPSYTKLASTIKKK